MTTKTETKDPVLSLLPPAKTCFECLEYFATHAADRTSLIYTDRSWMARQGKKKRRQRPLSDPTKEFGRWNRISYQHLYEYVQRLEQCLLNGGLKRGDRVIILFFPTCRLDLVALMVALQAASCVPLFARPKAFGGLRGWARVMLSLQADAILCSRSVLYIFQALAFSILSGSGSSTASTTTTTPLQTPTNKKPPALKWINAPAVLDQAAVTVGNNNLSNNPKFQPAASLDHPIGTMFSSGTTGPASPTVISHRMQNFQATNYATTLQERLASTNNDKNPTSTSTTTTSTTTTTNGPYVSMHYSINFIMLDLCLGGTAVLHPMGLNQPLETVCFETYQTWMQHFKATVASGPPAMWRQFHALTRQNSSNTTTTTTLPSLKVVFCGGGETEANFVQQSAALIVGNDNEERIRSSGFCRIYGSTQVLPMALASPQMVLQAEEDTCASALGCGVCLGRAADGLELRIDTKAWQDMGGKTSMKMIRGETVQVGELRAIGKPISPSIPLANDHLNGQSLSGDALDRLFRTGDVAYIDPISNHLYFLGRLKQAVDCGEPLGMVPAAGIETLCLQSQAVSRCALVGPKSGKGGTILPTLVVQLMDNNEKDAINDDVKAKLRRAMEKSAWFELLKSPGLHLVVYPKKWPVDERHSSKTNRFLLRDWAAKQMLKNRKILHEL